MTVNMLVPGAKNIRWEWDKVRRNRSLLIVLGILLFGTGVFALFYAWISDSVSGDGTAVPASEVLAFCVVKASLAPPLASLLGALLGGMECRDRAWALTLLRFPLRAQALNAKFTVVGVAAAAGALFAAGVAAAVIAVMLGPELLVADLGVTVRLLLSHVAVTVCWGLVGCALGVALRSALGAVGVLVAFAVVLEPALKSVAEAGGWGAGAASWLPLAVTTSAQVPAGGNDPLFLFGSSAAELPPAASAAALVGYAVVAVAAAHFRFSRQNV